jgi:pimeloyl-[acyl-carrier protein] methyl ester esterase
MKGEPLYGIPGWGFSVHSLAWLAPLSDCFHGVEYIYEQNTSLTRLVQALANKIDPPATLFAWSLGGLLAIQLAYQFPEKVKRIIFYASSPRFLADTAWQGVACSVAEQFMRQAEVDFPRLQNQFIRKVSHPDPQGLIRKQLKKHWINRPTQRLIELLALLFTTDLRVQYARLTQPILHFVPQRDAILRLEKCQLKKLNPNAQISVLPEGGHAGFLTHPFFVQKTIIGFLHGLV